jgi:TPR repeat protein
MMLKACRGAVLATGVLSLPLVAMADCPPEDSIDRYTQTAGDALSALHELVPESQLRALEDRYAAMVMLKWQWQGRDAIRANSADFSQVLSCYEQARCGVRASEQISADITANLNQNNAEPQVLEDLIPVQPSARSYAWARRILECDRPAPAPVLTAEIVEEQPLSASPVTTTAPDQTETEPTAPQFASTLTAVSFDTVETERAADTPQPDLGTDLAAPAQTIDLSVDPESVLVVEPAPVIRQTTADTEQLLLNATNLVFSGKPREAISPLQEACLREAPHTDKSAPCETLFSVYTNALVATESANSSQDYRDLSQRLCDIGYSRGCDNLSRYYAAQNAPEAHRAAVAYAERSCDLANAEACATVSRFYLSGRASEPDPAAARAKLEQSCELGRLVSCQEVADFYLRGVGGAADPAMALRMIEASCPEGEAERADLCVSAADYILINERAGQARSVRVRAFIKRACDIGHDVGCAWYAEDLELGIGGAVDLAAARQARLTACEYGDQKSCNSRS